MRRVSRRGKQHPLGISHLSKCSWAFWDMRKTKLGLAGSCSDDERKVRRSPGRWFEPGKLWAGRHSMQQTWPMVNGVPNSHALHKATTTKNATSKRKELLHSRDFFGRILITDHTRFLKACNGVRSCNMSILHRSRGCGCAQLNRTSAYRRCT